MNRRRLGWSALAVVIAGHLLALYLPGSPGPGTEFFPHQDKLVHVLLFGIPAVMLRRLTLAWWPILVLVGHAVISELVQHWWIPYRSGDPLDLLADLVGIGLGVGLASAWTRQPKILQTPPGSGL